MELGVEIEGFYDVSAILRAGVYVLAYRGVVVYIGKSKTMLNRVYTHRSMYGAKTKPSWIPVKGILYDSVWVRPCSLEVIDDLERGMIELYKPRFNTKLKPPTQPGQLVINGIALGKTSVPPKPEIEHIERRL